MRINEVQFDDSRPVDGYGPGFFRVGGDRYEGPLVILPSGIQPWGGVEDLVTLTKAADEVDVLFIGMGAETAPVPAALRQALEAQNIGVEGMATPAACRTYNVLLS
ncbi:MAG: Mth938-like domain-containing protein, partial [Pseudomonadota bacterium]